MKMSQVFCRCNCIIVTIIFRSIHDEVCADKDKREIWLLLSKIEYDCHEKYRFVSINKQL